MVEVKVPQPAFRLLYEQKDVTVELAPVVLAVTYTDVLEGESDELTVSIEDRDHRWKNRWFPGKGARLSLAMGYAGRALANMGSFEIDEIEFTGAPDTVNIRALAAGVKEALRTESTVAYEGKTLEQIAAEVAGRSALPLVGAGDAIARVYDRVTQHRETDLAFLNRLGAAEGIVFSVKDGRLVWHDRDKIDEAADIFVVKRTDMMQFTFRAKTATTYKACQVSYHDPRTKSLVTHTEQGAEVPSGDTLKLIERCENLEQAKAKAKAALRTNNGLQVEGTISLYGDQRLRAGCNIEVQGLGLLDGRYQTTKATHSMERRQGYSTDVELSTTLADNKNLQAQGAKEGGNQ